VVSVIVSKYNKKIAKRAEKLRGESASGSASSPADDRGSDILGLNG